MRAFRFLAVIVITAMGVTGCHRVADAKARTHKRYSPFPGICFGVCCPDSPFRWACLDVLQPRVVERGFNPDLYWPDATWNMTIDAYQFPGVAMDICNTTTRTDPPYYLIIQTPVGSYPASRSSPRYQVRADVYDYSTGNMLESATTQSLPPLAPNDTFTVSFQFDNHVNTPAIPVRSTQGLNLGSQFVVQLAISTIDGDARNNTATGFCAF